jgi:hypothetical protein
MSALYLELYATIKVSRSGTCMPQIEECHAAGAEELECRARAPGPSWWQARLRDTPHASSRSLAPLMLRKSMSSPRSGSEAEVGGEVACRSMLAPSTPTINHIPPSWSICSPSRLPLGPGLRPVGVFAGLSQSAV